MKKEFESNGGKWEKYTLEHAQLFQIKGSKSLDEGKLTFTEKGINFVGRVDDNNGIKGKISLQDFNPNEKNTITATVIGNYKYAKFQESEYYCSQNINVLKPNFEINRFIALYLVTHIQKFISKYNGQQSGYKLNELAKHEIILPTLNKSLAFDYMERYIGELEQARVSELAAYLRAAGLENYDLTAAEQTALDDFKNNRLNFKEFKIGELFDVSTPKRKFNANSVKFGGRFPYVVRTSLNNGIRDFLDEDESFLNPAGTISFGQDTATIFYQEKPYFTGDKIKILRFKLLGLNEKIANFMLTLMRKSFSGFQWGQSSFNEKVLKNVVIELPVTNGTPDFAFMESFVTAQQKLAIRDVVLWKDKVISKTLEVINIDF